MKNRELVIVTAFIFLAVVAASLVLLSLPLAVLVIVGLTVGITVFFKPFYGLLLYVILLYIRPQDFMPALEKMRVMLVLAVVIILFFILHSIVNRKPMYVVMPRQSALMLLLLTIIPLSNMVNFQFMAAWKGLNEFLTVYLLFMIVVNIVDEPEKLSRICWILVVCTFFLSVNGILQHLRGYDLVGTTMIDGRIRWIGIFNDPNDLALVILSFFPFVLVNLWEKHTQTLKKIALVVVGIANMLALYYTESRGGYIALVLILGFFSYRRWGLLRGLIMGGAFLVLIFAVAPSRLESLSPYEQSASGRVYAWIDGLVMLKSRPVLGVGFQRFTSIHGRAAHSAAIQCVAELGLTGFFVWIALIYTSISDILRAGKQSPSPKAQKHMNFLLLSLVGFLGSAFFLSQAYSPVLYMLTALSVAAVRSSGAAVKQPTFLLGREVLLIAGIVGMSIAAYKLLAMVYI